MSENEQGIKHYDIAPDNEYNMLMSALRVSVSRHLMDAHFTLISANPYYYELIGYPKDEYEALFHNRPDIYFNQNPEDWSAIVEKVAAAAGAGHTSYEAMARMYHKSGRAMWIKMVGVFTDEVVDGCPVAYTVMTDMTDYIEQEQALQRSNAKLLELAFVDPMTRGPNRSKFDMDAGGAILEGAPGDYVLVSMDIRKFKLINDLFGIEMGDQTLRYVYEVMRRHLKDDELVCRAAADNFCLLLQNADKRMLVNRLERMAQDINSFNDGCERKYFLSLAFGIYPVLDPNLPLTQQLDRANVALKNVKDAGDSRLFACQFYSDLDRLKLMREKDMENRMQDALLNGEFVVYLQPKLSLKDDAIAGAEALVRWQDPERGLIPPDEFIPFFEKNRFIVEVDLYVFEQVCILLRGWLDRGVKPVPISVNMSRAHLADADFLDAYEAIRSEYSVPPELLEIELTETLVFTNPEMLFQVIDQIHRRGYRCSMDDFGSGYSSLNLLKDLQMDTLKLDRAFFTSQNADNPRERDVVTSVIDMAEKLSMSTVAEGVESQKQVEFLRQSSCDMVQGYVFSRPVPIPDFETLAFGGGETDNP
ncbi:putative bifunctional diguanylate cyclase/phosphodiesterase [Eubacterium maltosivorans]|uniref:GGDEF domain-containing protein n=1 Tax=Eubacterium maltosivorans TaxID=2041044 RepID=A0A4P9CAQ4_EUBML|nr:EAL domain-containing protein [Eubacterium maltosivorans]QCT72669.1 GGDEF domain-containing protein [Eubacterium maltosivorans]